MDYSEYIENTRLIGDIDYSTTSGDLDYDGIALEISEKDGSELFHIVTDKNGILQILFFKTVQNYRMPLELFEKVMQLGKENVRKL